MWGCRRRLDRSWAWARGQASGELAELSGEAQRLVSRFKNL
jgi:hypothetical protein